MSTYHQRGDSYKPKHKVGSVDEEYLNMKEMAAARKAIMAYKLKDPPPTIYTKRKNKSKQQ